MRKNTKIILTSLALLASASVLAPSAVVSAADQPATNVAATTATSQNSDLQTITMTITKTGSTTHQKLLCSWATLLKLMLKTVKLPK